MLTGGADALPLFERLDRETEWCTVHVADLEVIQTLRRFLRMNVVSQSEATAALRLFPLLPLVRFSHFALVDAIWALRDNVSAYDGAYAALAMAMNAPLVTTDARLARALSGRLTVELVEPRTGKG